MSITAINVSWLQGLHRGALRVQQRDWSDPQLDRWGAASRARSSAPADRDKFGVTGLRPRGCMFRAR